MRSIAPADVAVVDDGSVHGEEEHRLYSRIEDCLGQLEGKTARKESLDPYEYHALIASLLA
ncbi:MAG: hypothetical protein JOZ19_13285 [Rubrobacter sp.]|nr:hypothetical protein [Rubrobacter sp.]